jgi:hypothetical protein
MGMLATTNIKKEVVTMLVSRRFTLGNVNFAGKFDKLYKHDLGINF